MRQVKAKKFTKKQLAKRKLKVGCDRYPALTALFSGALQGALSRNIRAGRLARRPVRIIMLQGLKRYLQYMIPRFLQQLLIGAHIVRPEQ